MTVQASQIQLPIVATEKISEVADSVWVIPDSEHTRMVPNIGIVVGERATLVIDTGFGPANARATIDKARQISGQRPIFLTHTHFHPEHGFGANVVAEEVTVAYNEAQWIELQEKGPTALRMFRKQMPALAPLLEGVEFVAPDLRYSGSLNLDLGNGIVVELREIGGGHSRGDQSILVNGRDSVLFAGDLIVEGYFGDLPDNEADVLAWIDRLNHLEQLDPETVVPGHGSVGRRELIASFRGHFEYCRDRVLELRAADELSEAEIVDQVTAEMFERYPGWRNRNFVRSTVQDLTWPTRA
jgi:glyoxylase-like metal-dependent hydrolase (beta-lactamase superfamily II)